jgi:hydroxypyruvate isomerase
MPIAPQDCSACIEMLFTEQPDYPARIRAAHAAGYKAVEFWLWSPKDLAPIQTALAETGLGVAGFCAEPMISLNDPANHAAFLAALPASIETAQRLHAPFLYIQGGSNRPGISRANQTAALTAVLKQAADILKGTEVTLLLEPVSDAKDGFLTHAADGLRIVADVGRPEIRLLYDLFHAAVAGETTAATVGAATNLIGHVHIADHPGRGAPGTGTLNLDADTAWLRAQGYKGLFGCEFLPQFTGS